MIRCLDTLKEHPYIQRLVTFETFDKSDEETGPDQQKDNDKDKDNQRMPTKSNASEL